MRTQQTIAVIGDPGIIQRSLLKALSKENYRLLLCSKQLDAMLELSDDIRAANASADVETMECSFNASWEADLIISSLTDREEKAIAEKIEEVANQKILISIRNLVVNSHNGLLFTAVKNAADELQTLLPNCKVIKVYYDDSSKQGSEAILAGEDREALEIVSQLLLTAGVHATIATAIRA